MNLKQTIYKAAVEFAMTAEPLETKHAQDTAIMSKFQELAFHPEDYEYFKNEFTTARERFTQLGNTKTVSEQKAAASTPVK